MFVRRPQFASVLPRLAELDILPRCSAAALAVALLALPTSAGAKPLDRFYGSVGGSLSTYGGGGLADQSTSWRNFNASVGRYFTARNQVSIDVWLNESTTRTEGAGLPYSLEYFYDSLSLSLNAHRTLWQRGRLSLTGGFGFGIETGTQRQTLRFKGQGTDIQSTHDHRRFQHNVSSNVHWQVTNRVSLSAGYRVSWTDLEEGTSRQSMLNLSMRLSVGNLTGNKE